MADRCPHCGSDVAPTAKICSQCGKGLSGRALLGSTPSASHGNDSSGTTVLVCLSLLGLVVGTLLTSQATLGVGMIAGSCLFAILARIAQANAHHRAVMQLLSEERAKIR